MAVRSVLAAVLVLLPTVCAAAGNTTTTPDTPAGHALGAWLDAFNSGDRAAFEAFAKARAPWLDTDREMASRARTGGFELLGVEEGSKFWLVFRAREKSGGKEARGRLIVRSWEPEHITLLGFEPAEKKPPDFVLDEASRSRVIEGAAKAIEQFYLFPDVGKKVAAKLKTRAQATEYSGMTDAEMFAIRLSDDLVLLSGDKHLGVDFFQKPLADEPTSRRPRPDPATLVANNCGLEAASHYRPNIGYLKINSFEEPEYCAPTATAAMNFLADSDALIVDLRDNGGGSPTMSAWISSYLFNEPTHLDDMFDRHAGTTEPLWTVSYVPGKKLTNKPVFVLTAKRTFSVGELFTYDLKLLKRATLIGEVTGGGAHTVSPHRIDEHFAIRVPFGGFINPITKTDWEGKGVEPDIKVARDDALEEALRRAREQIAGAQAATQPQR